MPCQMTILVVSNDMVMKKRKQLKKAAGLKKTGKANSSQVQEPATAYVKQANAEEVLVTFKVTRGGRQTSYSIKSGYGYFIPSLRKATSLSKVNELVERGIKSKEVSPIIEYLGLTVPEVAKAAAVSPSTVSRWKDNSSIGVAGSDQFFRIDEVIRKGVDLFGSPEDLRGWLQNPNLALGNTSPAKLMTSRIGVEMVDEALDALHYGIIL